MIPDERAEARRDELEMLLIHEAVSIAVMGVLLVMLSPRVQIWLKAQAHRFRTARTRAQEREEAMVAQLRRELSHDLPVVERGEAIA